MSDVLEQVDFVLLEETLDGPPSCESLYERENQFPEHAATWFVTAPCGTSSPSATNDVRSVAVMVAGIAQPDRVLVATGFTRTTNSSSGEFAN